MRYKEKGEDPGHMSHYVFMTCGGCHQATDTFDNGKQARKGGWVRRGEWGWLCPDCKNRIKN